MVSSFNGFISKWKKAFFKSGVEGLKVAHQGSVGLLMTSEFYFNR